MEDFFTQVIFYYLTVIASLSLSFPGFVSEEALTELLTELRGRVRSKMTRRGKKKFKKEKNSEQNVTGSQQENLVLLHSGILGLCSFVEGM